MRRRELRRDRRLEMRGGRAAGSWTPLLLGSALVVEAFVKRAQPLAIACDALRALCLDHRGPLGLCVRARRLVAASARRVRGACELLDRSKTVGRSLLIGWAFGSRPVRRRTQLDRHRLYLSIEHARLARLGRGGSAVAYLAIYPALATGLAWRFGRDNRVVLVLVLGGAWTITEWLRGTMFTGFPWNPAAAALAPTPVDHRNSAHRDLCPVRPGGPARRCRVARILPEMAAAGDDTRRDLAGSTPVLIGPARSADDRQRAHRAARHRPEDKWRPGFDERGGAAAGGAVRPAERRAAAADVARSRGHRPLSDARADEHQAMARVPAHAARPRCSGRRPPADRRNRVALADGSTSMERANSVYVLAQGGRIIGRYDKAHLVPYGEYLPMRPLLSAIGLSRLAPGDIDFTPGPGPRTIDIGGEFGKGRHSALLRNDLLGRCRRRAQPPRLHLQPFERRVVRQLGPAAAPRPGAAARRRGRHSMLRSTPTGISAVIDGHGNVVKELPWRTAGVIDAVLPAAAVSPPLFARFGNVIPLLLDSRSSSAALCSDGADAKASYKDFLISLKSRTRLRLCVAHICSRPNPFRKVTPTRSPTRFRTRSSICSCPRTPKRGSHARR